MSNDQLFDLSGKVAFVTGAGSGLGIECADILGEAGTNVVCTDVNPTAAEATTSKLHEIGRKSLAIDFDVTVEDQLRSATDESVSKLGRIDILFNNAEIADPAPAPIVASSTAARSC